MSEAIREDMLERERIANRKKHWVRAVTACNSRCLFCLDSDTPRNLFLPFDDVVAELRRGREELDADKVIISGGEASLHPRFHELIAAGRAMGYDRVQTVTNGWMFADKAFYEAAVAAGLGEITFSLHGHTAELHDHLTQHPGSFARLVKGMVRAVRRRDLIVNVDVVINKGNVAVIDKVLELCIGLGVREFDLLHVIPQAAAFDHRDELFYDPREHIETLHKVFRLNRHPGFTVWTNRFPVEFLEGLEDLIQDPHKMLDEVNGRRFQVRRYLDGGAPLDCRQPERCVHCFIEPFCTSADRVIAAVREQQVAWWELGEDPVSDLTLVRDGDGAVGGAGIAVRLPDVSRLAELALPAEAPLLLRFDRLDEAALEQVPERASIEVAEPEQLDLLLANPGRDLSRRLCILLNVRTAAWLLAHRERVEEGIDGIEIRQPSWEHLAEAAAEDVRDPASFFAALALPVAVSGLPACFAPGARLLADPVRLPVAVFDRTTGRLAIRALARHHVDSRYRARSLRCSDCRVQDRCEGPSINMVRDQGLALCRPLVEGAWADEAEAQLLRLHPEPPPRLADGKPVEAPAPSLPGFPEPGDAPVDPLASLARDKAESRRARRLEILG